MANEKKISFEFDPFRRAGVKVDKEQRAEALDRVKEFILESVLDKVGSSESPVSGGPWKTSLSKEYKKVKGRQSSSTVANLELTGELLDAIAVNQTGDRKLKLEIIGGTSVKNKAEGNNIGSYGRSASRSKARRFIPLSGETLSSDIWNGVASILEEFSEDDSNGN